LAEAVLKMLPRLKDVPAAIASGLFGLVDNSEIALVVGDALFNSRSMHR